jgi:acetyl-CoA carboxylase biotin carboxyl carrier protein
LSEKKSTKKNAPAKEGGAKKSSGSSGPMDISLLDRLVKLMQSHDLNMVELRDGDRRVILKRGPADAVMVPQMLAAPQAPAPEPAKASTATPQAETENLLAIKSPMVGTFYAAPSPDADPFIRVGSNVDEESDVCVIEAMKVFNNVKAECRGTIAKILVTNGQAVEFGQTLFLVKP